MSCIDCERLEKFKAQFDLLSNAFELFLTDGTVEQYTFNDGQTTQTVKKTSMKDLSDSISTLDNFIRIYTLRCSACCRPAGSVGSGVLIAGPYR